MAKTAKAKAVGKAQKVQKLPETPMVENQALENQEPEIAALEEQAEEQQQAAKALTTAAKHKLFIACLRHSANVSSAARNAGLVVSTIYRQRAKNPTFAAQWDSAIAEAVDALEEAVLLRVRDGVEKPVHYGGKEIAKLRIYSDALAMFVLKSKRPEVYARAAMQDGLAQPLASMTDDDAEQEFDRRIARLKAL